jgi:uncharacterized RDD family membrane protein YckC
MSESELLPFEIASPQHRLGGRAIDGAFLAITFYIGWIVWSLVVWGHGQTPGHQIVKMRIYSIDTGKPASWGHMALRQVVLPFSFALAPMLIGGVITAVPSTTTQLIGMIILYLGLVAVFLIDVLWIFRGSKRQRLVDVFARTVVLNECIPTAVHA